jgi:2-dehydropantoate 2-reductase
VTSVAIYGAGGVGAYFGGRLAQGGADVSLVARGAHLDALRADGLRVESVHGDFSVDLPATDDPAEVGPVDYVLVTVKSFDTDEVAASLDPLLHDETAVVSLQNGVDNEAKLAAAAGEDRVLSGVAYIFSTIAEPGVVEHTGGPARVVFGERDGRRSDRAERLLDLFESGGVDADLSTDVEADVWEKFVFICAQAGMTAATRLPVGEIRETPESWAMYRRLLAEVAAVARAEGVNLSDDTVDRWTAFAEDLDPDAYSSLHYDLTHGKRMELEAFQGTVVRRADATDVAVPASEAVYALLRPWARRNDPSA